MGLLVKTLELQDFRSFGEKVVGLAPATTILCGPNAAGKTNTVEALQLLTAGYSFRHPTPTQLVREGAQAARASARLEGDGRVVDLRCDVVSGRRQFFRNGKRIQASEVSGTLMSVLFTPDDLQLVKRSASFRRDELDDFGRQANRGFASVLATYTRSIEQRNRLLTEERPDLDLLDAWDASVALGGATLLHGRLRLFERLRAKVCEVYGELAAGEGLECRYICSLGDEALGLSKDELRELFCARLAAVRPDDLRRQQTTVGPHRDEIAFSIDGRDARDFASQGQQRSLVLAWKIAEAEVASDILGRYPMLLLDDVMSELDARRREAITGFVRGEIQTIITTTNQGYFSQDVIDRAKVVHIDA